MYNADVSDRCALLFIIKDFRRGCVLASWGCLMQFSTVITREENYYVALCPELDVASQGGSVEESLANLKEAISLYFEDEDAVVPRTRSFR